MMTDTKNNSQDMANELDLLAGRLRLKNLSETSLFPKYFEIETIRACNARCRMCTIPKWKDKNNIMCDKLFSKISEEMSPYAEWIHAVCISRNGEPLLDKTLLEKIRKLKDSEIKYVTFSTNASLLDEKKSIALIESGLDDIRFSIDGATKKTFEYIRRGLDFEQVIENCLRFIKLRDERGTKPTIQIRMVLQKENQSEEEAFKKFWLPKVSKHDVVYSKPMHSWGSQLSNYEGDIKTETEKYSRVPCISLWSTMIVHFDGKVPLCGCDYNNKIMMGDVNKSTIKEIWQSKKFNEIRELHSSGKRNEVDICHGCNIWDLDRKRVYSGKE